VIHAVLHSNPVPVSIYLSEAKKSGEGKEMSRKRELNSK